MFKFNNNHIFTGYLKQLLSSVNIPNCRIYTREFANYFSQHGSEDPRVIESFETATYNIEKENNKPVKRQRIATNVNYLKANSLYSYIWKYSQYENNFGQENRSWTSSSNIFYDRDSNIPGLTRTLNSPGTVYDTTTHEFLGDYLRFMRDYYNINLMSLYNCFNNEICTNIYYKHTIKTTDDYKNTYKPDISSIAKNIGEPKNADDKTAINLGIKNKNNLTSSSSYKNCFSTFDSHDQNYRIYSFPVKLFSNYTIAIDCSSGIELFCGLYTTNLETTSKGLDLISKTYKKVNSTFFNQPFLYDGLDVKYWNFNEDTALVNIEKSTYKYPRFMTDNNITRWDIANREQDLRLFIKVPSSCKSSIVVLEGDFRRFNNSIYKPPGTYNPDGTLFDSTNDNKERCTAKDFWEYKQNNTVINFGDGLDRAAGLDINSSPFKPIGKLQLLALNTGESYPFADRLIEYLCNSTITPVDQIADNIKRTQKVMSNNKNYFRIDGIWEDKMQKILYDYMMNSGPIEIEDGKLVDKRLGYYSGHRRAKSTLYDVLGYVDRDAEKQYSSRVMTKDDRVAVEDTIQNVNIYGNLYDN